VTVSVAGRGGEGAKSKKNRYEVKRKGRISTWSLGEKGTMIVRDKIGRECIGSEERQN